MLAAGFAYWLPLNLPDALLHKSSLRFRTPRDYGVLLGSIFALQAFALRPQPTQSDSLVVLPMAMISLMLYEQPLPPLKDEARGVSDVNTRSRADTPG